MAKLLAEDAILFYAFIYIVSIVVFNMNLWGAYYPNQEWNSTTNSLEYVVADASPSIFANTNEFNSTFSEYGNASNSSMMDPGALVNPLGIVNMIGYYLGFILNILGSGYLYLMMSYFIGTQWAWVISFFMNLLVIIVFIRIISGRVRWT